MDASYKNTYGDAHNNIKAQDSAGMMQYGPVLGNVQLSLPPCSGVLWGGAGSRAGLAPAQAVLPSRDGCRLACHYEGTVRIRETCRVWDGYNGFKMIRLRQWPKSYVPVRPSEEMVLRTSAGDSGLESARFTAGLICKCLEGDNLPEYPSSSGPTPTWANTHRKSGPKLMETYGDIMKKSPSTSQRNIQTSCIIQRHPPL